MVNLSRQLGCSFGGVHAQSTLRLAWLDSARAMAVLLVIGVHFGHSLVRVRSDLGLPEIENDLIGSLHYGTYGPHVFFFISGYLLTAIYWGKGDSGDIKSYWKRRLARILPLWWIFSSVGIVLWLIGIEWGWFMPYSELSHYSPIQAFLLTIFFLTFVSPEVWNTTVLGGWSIQVEMINYLIFAALWKKRFGSWVFTGLVLAGFSLLASEDMLGNFSEIVVRTNILSSYGFFFVGFVFAQLANLESRAKLLNEARRFLIPLCAFGWVFLFAPGIGEFNIQGLVVTGAVAALSVVLNRGPTRPKALDIVGRYSYFIYFFHFFMIFLAERILYRVTLYFPNADVESMFIAYLIFAPLLVLLTSVGVGHFSFRFLEDPVMRIARKSN